MRVFVNRNIRKLFVQMALCMAAVVLISVLPVAVRIGGRLSGGMICSQRI